MTHGNHHQHMGQFDTKLIVKHLQLTWQALQTSCSQSEALTDDKCKAPPTLGKFDTVNSQTLIDDVWKVPPTHG